MLFKVKRKRSLVSFSLWHGLKKKSDCHSHKKRKDSLETRVALFIFLLELEISGVDVQSIHQNSEKL